MATCFLRRHVGWRGWVCRASPIYKGTAQFACCIDDGPRLGSHPAEIHKDRQPGLEDAGRATGLEFQVFGSQRAIVIGERPAFGTLRGDRQHQHPSAIKRRAVGLAHQTTKVLAIVLARQRHPAARAFDLLRLGYLEMSYPVADAIKHQSWRGHRVNRERLRSIFRHVDWDAQRRRDNAAKVAYKAHKENLTLRAASVELGLLSGEEFDRLVRPEEMLKPSEKI